MIDGLEPWAQEALRVGTGLASGALIGLERGWKLRDQKAGYRVAGVRTFSLLGLGGGIAGRGANCRHRGLGNTRGVGRSFPTEPE